MSESYIINEITKEYLENQKDMYVPIIYGIPLNSLTKIELEALLVKFHKDWKITIWEGIIK